jgi:Lon protease-like protein
VALEDQEAQPVVGSQKPRQIKVHRVVGLGYIEGVQPLKDGRSNIVLRGTTRVRILEELVTDEPYRMVRAEPIADLQASAEELTLSAAILRRLAAQLLLRLPRELAEAISRAMAEVRDPGGLADLVAASVLIDPRQRQTFLEERNVQRRLSLSTHLVAGLLAELGSTDDARLAN